MSLAVAPMRLARIAPMPNEGEPERMRVLREQAAVRFQELGLPNQRLEAWKYTSLAAMGKLDFRLPAAGEWSPGAIPFRGIGAIELVFVNGILDEGRSARGPLKGVSVRSLRDPQGHAALERYLGLYADTRTHAMTALNTAVAADGAIVETVAGTHDTPVVHLIFINGGTDADPVMVHPRILIVAAANSHLSVIETYVGEGTYLTNAVTELVAEEGAAVDHYRIQFEPATAFHIGTLQIHQERGSSVISHNVSAGSKLARIDINASLAGEGASVTLDGLFIGAGSQHVDNHTIIDHVKPHCESMELYKGILDGTARGIFDGTIIVRPDAVKTSSRQVNRNLLLSESAIVDSKPTLEIHNDDVKCNHGSTIGQLDDEALFYLRSRGMSATDARDLLVHAFAGEIIDRIRVEGLREQVRSALSPRTLQTPQTAQSANGPAR